MRRIKQFGIILLMLSIVLGFGINYVFYEPTEMNAFIAAKIYKAPANSYFKDDNFYKLVVDAYNDFNDTSFPYTINLTDEQLKTIQYLTIDCETVWDEETGNEYCSSDTKIDDISGLEKLTSLYSLTIYDLMHETIDISSLISLTDLTISYTNIRSIDVSNNTELLYLDLEANMIDTLDVSKNEKLEQLYVSFNDLTNIDVSNNINLEVLDVSDTEITSLDVTNNTKLDSLYASGTEITGIDLAKNNELTILELGTKAMYGIGCPGDNCYIPSIESYITNLDLSNNQLLEELYVDNAPIESLNLSKNTNLYSLSATGTSLTSLDLSVNTKLISLDITDSDISELKLGNAPLEILDVSGTNLTTLNLNDYQNELYDLNISGTSIESINLSNLQNLEYLYVNGTDLVNLDVSNNIILKTLMVGNEYYYKGVPVFSNFKVTNINLKNNTELKNLYISGATIEELDLTNNINLEYINLSNYMYVYKGNSININPSIRFPEGFELSGIEWNSYDEEYATVSSDGVVNALKSGVVPIESFTENDGSISYNNYILINIVEITSDKYTVDNENSLITITDSAVDTIKSNINVPSGITLDIDLDNNKLYVKHDNNILKEFNVKIEEEIINPFTDENFYKAVVDAYNEENKTNVGYDTILTDAQLKTITELSFECEYGWDEDMGYYFCKEGTLANDVNGLEKLTSLTALSILGTNIETIDLSKNINLKHLNLGDEPSKYSIFFEVEYSPCGGGYGVGSGVPNHKLKELNISNNLMLETLGVSGSALTELDLSKNINLEYVYANNTLLTSLDVSKNVNLKGLDVSEARLTELILGDVKLNELHVSGNKLTNIEFNKNHQFNLYGLAINDNPIETIDLTGLSYLSELQIAGTNIKSLDLSGNTSLDYLLIGNDKVTSLNLESNTFLKKLIINDSLLKELDLRNIENINSLVIKNSPVEKILFGDISKMDYINIENTKLRDMDLSTFASGIDDVGECYRIDFKKSFVGEALNIYAGEEIKVNTKIKFPTFYNPSIIWSSSDANKVTVDDNGIVKAIDSGVVNIDGKIQKCEYDYELDESFCYYDVFTTNVVNIYRITSDRYIINEKNNLIVVDSDADVDTIKNNINVPSGITLDIDLDNNKLYVKHGNNILKIFTITKESIKFDENITVDNEKGFLSNIDISTKVTGILERIITDNEIVITNKDNRVLSENDVVGTGSKVIIKSADDIIYEYTIVISGDINGDGELKLPDIMKIANYVYKDNNSLSGVYAKAADYDGNGKYNLQDIMKPANRLYG